MPPSCTVIQQWPFPPPAQPDSAKDKDIKFTPCPAYIPTRPSDDVDKEYEDINVGQSFSGRRAAVEGEYEKVQSSLIKEEVGADGQNSSNEAEAVRGEHETIDMGQK